MKFLSPLSDVSDNLINCRQLSNGASIKDVPTQEGGCLHNGDMGESKLIRVFPLNINNIKL